MTPQIDQTDQTRLLIVDDHAIVRKGVTMFLVTDPSIEIIGEAEDGQDAIRMTLELRPDVILMDLVMPDMDGVEATACLKQCRPDVKIIVLTTFKDRYKIQAAMAAGADGYLLKDADGEALIGAIRSVQRGELPLDPSVARSLLTKEAAKPHVQSTSASLTKRETEILQLVAGGLSNKEIAQTLDLAVGTVKCHVSNVLSKLSVASRTEAAMLAVEWDLISLGKVQEHDLASSPPLE